MRTVHTLAIMGLVTAVATTARANMIINPTLSSGVPVPSVNLVYISDHLNNSALGAWDITKGTVDIVTSKYWQLPEGVQFSVDLVGTPNASGIGATGPGGIQQVIDGTLAGTQYLLTWDFSVNPEKPTVPGSVNESTDTKVLVITALGEEGQTLATKTISLAAGTRTRQDMQWIQESLSFVADGATTIRFEAMEPLNMPAGLSDTNMYTGPVVANIALDAQGGTDNPPDGGTIPEPASLATLGIGGTLLLRRKR